MNLPFIKRRRRIDKKLEALGFMPQIGVSFDAHVLHEYDDVPPQSLDPTEIAEALVGASRVINHAAANRLFANYLKWI